ncbi:MAG: SusC/RagA family TonB-linked outer membrane protein, partial [Chitinophagaceae bacterium]
MLAMQNFCSGPWVRKLKFPFLVIPLLFFSIFTSAQQTIGISGTVVSDSSVALSDVSVQVLGTSEGTVSNAEGKFSIRTTKGATLVFSSVGYEEQRLKVDSDNATLIVKLVKANVSNLNEVVVVSYGTQKRRDITGSIAQLNTSEVKDMPVSNIGQKLQGKFAGVQINQNTGQPGADMSFRIRGAASINAGNSPLIVIDGFPTESSLSSLSPSEIESISVLKDAAAASLYGSRAANGVILVTTRQAKSGKTNIEFSAFTGIQTVSKRGRPDLMNAREFAQFKKEYYEDAAIYEGYTGGVPVQYQNPSQYTESDGTDWFDVLLRKAPTQDYNLSLTTGTNSIRSAVNINYNRQDGVMLHQWAERFTARANNVFVANDWLTFGLNVS